MWIQSANFNPWSQGNTLVMFNIKNKHTWKK